MNCLAQYLACYSTSSISTWVVTLLSTNVKGGQQENTFPISGTEFNPHSNQALRSESVGPGLQVGLIFSVRHAKCRNKKIKWSLKKCQQALCSHADYIILFFMKTQVGRWQHFVQENSICLWLSHWIHCELAEAMTRSCSVLNLNT